MLIFFQEASGDVLLKDRPRAFRMRRSEGLNSQKLWEWCHLWVWGCRLNSAFVPQQCLQPPTLRAASRIQLHAARVGVGQHGPCVMPGRWEHVRHGAWCWSRAPALQAAVTTHFN